MQAANLKDFCQKNFALCAKWETTLIAKTMASLQNSKSQQAPAWGDSYIAPEGQLMSVDGLSDDDAVLIEPFAVSLHAVFKTRAKS